MSAWPHTVSDLTPVPLHGAHCRTLDVFFRIDVQADVITPLLRKSLDEGLPDELAFVGGELWVVELNVDSGYKGVVEGPYPVCREEQNPVVVLEASQERWTCVSTCIPER